MALGAVDILDDYFEKDKFQKAGDLEGMDLEEIANSKIKYKNLPAAAWNVQLKDSELVPGGVEYMLDVGYDIPIKPGKDGVIAKLDKAETYRISGIMKLDDSPDSYNPWQKGEISNFIESGRDKLQVWNNSKALYLDQDELLELKDSIEALQEERT